jgi:hypothetical protein
VPLEGGRFDQLVIRCEDPEGMRRGLGDLGRDQGRPGGAVITQEVMDFSRLRLEN